MKHLGEILKKHVETNHLVKGTVAKEAGISYNYLSTIFSKATLDAALWEKLCLASGLNPAVAFSDTNSDTTTPLSTKNTETTRLKELLAEKEKQLAEKERTITILLRQVDLLTPTNTPTTISPNATTNPNSHTPSEPTNTTNNAPQP
jgi:AraC-like DNA-binding protein